MDKRAYYSRLFLIGGIWNLAAILPVWIMGLGGPAAFALFGMGAPPTLFFFTAMTWFIVAFGVGYFFVSRDIDKNHGVVVIGAIAKVAFFVDCVVVVALEEAGASIIAFGAVDMVFVVLFVEFLLWTRKGAAK
ncbi:MAG: hypothetical protein JW839_01925 [Candidatus Lokiarchaeota archaeon]|nr:hypothetical protein [Candidatus Lokiarchaeota archaeon]